MVTEIIVRIDKITKETLIILLDGMANIGYIPYITINGPLSEMKMEYYYQHTKKADKETIEAAVAHVKERYEVDDVIVRQKFPVNFRNRIWPDYQKNRKEN